MNKEKKHLGKINFALYLVFHGTRYIFPLAITPYLATKLSPAYFGDFVLWNACVWASSLLIEFGFYIYAIKWIAETNNREELHKAVSAIISAKAILSPLGVAVFLATAFGLGLAERQPVATAIGVIGVLAYGGSLAWFLQGLQRGGRAITAEGAPLVLQFVLVFLLVHGPADLWIAAGLQIMAALLTITISIVMMRSENVTPRIDIKEGINAISIAIPYFVERLCHTLYSTATPILIAALSTPVQVAFFGVGEKVNSFLTGLCLPLAQAAMPIVSRRIAPGREDWSLSIKLVAGMTTLTIVLAIAINVAIGPLMHWFFESKYDAAIVVARLFCVTSVFAVLQFTLANFIIIPGGRAGLLMKSGICALIVSFCAQVAVVPLYGAVGAVVARTLAEMCSALILGYVAIKLVRRKPMTFDDGRPEAVDK